jgi:RNA polymerase sigma-70 factor (ECF subfamily)
MSGPESSEDELLRLSRTGDEEAFIALYRRHQAGIYRFALRMTGSGALAEDMVQEVFMALVSETGKYDARKGSLSAYLYGIARNCILRHIGRNRMYVAMCDAGEGENAADALLISSTDPLRDLTRNESTESLRQAILSLPAQYREVVVLCDLQEMSYADAALVLNCAIGTVRSRLHRGRSFLTEKLRSSGWASAADPRVSRCLA